MPQQELLAEVVGALGRLGLDYMITGSIVSSLYGQPRSTHDIDVVVVIPPHLTGTLAGAFADPDYYLDEQAIREAVQRQDMFNLIDTRSGDKVDFWMLTDDEFDRSRFSRRRVQQFSGVRMWVPAPEDAILSKLRWAQMAGGSEKQFLDALSVYEVQFHALDMGYLGEWADRLGVQDLWERLRQEAEVV